MSPQKERKPKKSKKTAAEENIGRLADALKETRKQDKEDQKLIVDKLRERIRELEDALRSAKKQDLEYERMILELAEEKRKMVENMEMRAG